MPSADYNAIVRLIYGRRNSGKSFLARRLAKDQSRVFFWDTTGHDFDESDGFVIEDMETLKQFLKVNYRKPFAIVYRSPDPLEEITPVCDLLMDVEHLWLVIDEAHNYFRAYKPFPGLSKVIHQGRHADVDLVLITQAPVSLGPMTRDQAEELYIFRTHESRIMDYFRDAVGSESVEKLPTLEKYHYLFYSDELEDAETRVETA